MGWQADETYADKESMAKLCTTVRDPVPFGSCSSARLGWCVLVSTFCLAHVSLVWGFVVTKF